MRTVFRMMIPHALFMLACLVLFVLRVSTIIAGFDVRAGFLTGLALWILFSAAVMILSVRYFRFYFRKIVTPLSPDPAGRFRTALQGGIPFYAMCLFCLVFWQVAQPAG